MRLALCIVFLLCSTAALPQVLDPMQTHGGPEGENVKGKLPNGKVQMDEILKADHAKSLEDLKQITELSQVLAAEMEHDTSHVLSLSSIRKTEEIEKLARRIRSRMRKF